MTAAFRLGQILRGHKACYTLTKELQDTVWLATNPNKQPVIIKAVQHFRLENERDALKRFQGQTPFIRPLLDEIVDPPDPPAIVLRHLDDHLLNASNSRTLTSREIKYVARRILEALKLLHGEGFVHTDVKPDNVLVNYGSGNGDIRFTDVQLADMGATLPADSSYAKDGVMIGAPIWRSPEAHLQIGWSTATDIWSFGALILALIYGDNFFIFCPDVSFDHEEYLLRILTRQCSFFGPFPLSYQEIAGEETLAILAYIHESLPPEKQKPFRRISAKEVSAEDRDFLLKVMKMDPRDRPTAAELLEDDWFRGN
ncbi:serine/threonine protein kinase [Histoplasma capsulatum G186AR]|uniref:Serine/threonine protein kinase n=1 Tax=Ajellomyces capsulatus TaxID=5037 RepID=A0A8H8CYV4_AJECA|nr:serine/threonine protein kinase [Histoplasma capsulatum]QSS73542.1 serine/threonine protein kinase [Histoplasma capsulatum G186AR]